MTVATQPLPAGPIVMRQRWKDLLFLHWKWDVASIQATLPAGLTVDTYEGHAWLGIVPFYMCAVRPVYLPPVPGVSDFLELNVRTYVRDSTGNPGVWFYSLDCNRWIAVRVARKFFHLPYFDSTMQATVRDGFQEYRSQRRGAQSHSFFRYRGAGKFAAATRGTLEEFLIERYRLFASSNSGLHSGMVWHTPYGISEAKVSDWSTEPLALSGFTTCLRPPDHAVFSPGVDVRIYPLRKLSTLASA